MKYILLLTLFLFQYLLSAHGQKIEIKLEKSSTIDQINIEVSILDNADVIEVTPLELSCDHKDYNRYWIIELLHNGYYYRVFDFIQNLPGYGEEKVSFKRIRPNAPYKFNICIDLSKVQLQIKEYQHTIESWDSVYTKYGYDNTVNKNNDFGKYSLILRYVYLSDQVKKNLDLSSNKLEIEYLEK